MPQYFTIPLPNHPALMQVQNYMRRVLPEGTVYTDPATWDITLLVVEDNKGADLGAISVPDIPVFGVGGGVVERFPAGDKGDPIVLGIDGQRSLYILQGSLYYAVTGAGAKVSAFSYPQAYRPHVTLAYAPPAVPPMNGDMKSAGGDGSEDARRYWWDAAAYDVHLEIRSFSLTDDGYETVKAWPLRTEVPAQEQASAQTIITSEMGAPIHVSETFARVGARERVHLTCVVEMRGAYPEIALPPDVERQEDDVFITLPVGAFNAESLNGRTYSEQAMRQMSDQVNRYRPGSNKGHIKDEDFGFHFEFPPVRWLASVISNGIIYAKGRAQTEESRQYFINAKRDNARVGTSLFAWAVSDGDVVTDLELISLDLADPARVGIPMTAAVPAVSSEMSKGQDEEPSPGAGAAPGSSETQDTTVEEQKSMDEKDIKALQEQLASAQSAHKSLQEQVAALTAAKEERDALVALLGKPEKPVEALQAFLNEQIESAVKTAAQECKVDAVRNRVIRVVMLQHPATKEQAEKMVRDELDRDDVKADIAAALKTEMGPAQRRPSGQTPEQGASKYVDFPETDAANA